jgi:serine kinase of HPr protein (carbohydrate metabolism regulator)
VSEATIHASCVSIGGRALLIIGRSGAGKSDLALRLIDRGAALVSDDYTRVTAEGDQVLASPPPTIKGKIEVRGVGIVEMPCEEQVPVALVVDLDRGPERLPEAGTYEVAGLAIPLVGLNGLEPSAPIKVEAALSLYGLSPLCRL